MTREELEEERSFLFRSLEDLEREHRAGDLSDTDHAALRDRYVARTATVLRSLDEAPPAAAPAGAGTAGIEEAGAVPPPGAGRGRIRWRRPVRWRGRRRALAVGVGVLVLLAVVFAVLVTETGIRLPGETVTGSVALTGAQATERTLAQAETLERAGNAVEALELYQSVLRAHPTNEEALAESGWLEYEAGAEAENSTLLAQGERREQKAETVEPAAYAPHLYLGSMLLAQGNAPAAVAQYREFLADRPPRATVVSAVSFISDAFTRAHQPVPALPTGGSSSG